MLVACGNLLRGAGGTRCHSGNGPWNTLVSVRTTPTTTTTMGQSRSRRVANATATTTAGRVRAPGRRSPTPVRSAPFRRPRASSRAAAPPPTAEPATVRPRRFDQAQELADRFKDGNAVILNLESADREVTR